MIVRSYSGRSVAEALEKVRKDLGEKALIIETRTLTEPGLAGRKMGYEVVAAGDTARLRVPDEGAPQQQPAAPASADQLRALPRRRYQPELERALAVLDQRHETAPSRDRTATAATATANQAAALQRFSEEPGGAHLSRELQTIRRQLARLAMGQETPITHLGDDLAERLQHCGLPAELIAECDDVLARAGDRLPASRRHDFLIRYLASRLPASGAIDWNHTPALMMVGPTGVGKTTTIAKLAGDLVLRQGRRVGLITIDTYRIGAADQLQAYADLLDAPCRVARSAEELATARHELAACEVVLIDTAGRSPADSARLDELRAFVAAWPGIQVMLALSATNGGAEFAAAVERFSVLPIEHSVVTKLDENQEAGRLYGCLRRHRLPLSYATFGQEVPDDIAPFNPARLGRSLLALPDAVGA